jgi:uncharacterized membrane protein
VGLQADAQNEAAMAVQPEHVTESQAHYKRRLEAFSDIIFGLSLSELALQLGLPKNPQELISSPLRYFVFFGSFALVCSLWIGHHRMFRVFSPTRTAVVLNFVYLAFTVLMPFGMQAFIKYPNNPIGIGIYLSCYAGTAASMCGLLILGLRSGTEHLTEDERLRVKGNLVRYVALLAVMLGGLIALRIGGFQAAGGAMVATVPAMLLSRYITARLKRASVARA